MESLTKRKISDNDILKIFSEEVCESSEITSIEEITNGNFNTVYKIVLLNGEKYIIKFSPKSSCNILTNEKNIMESEVKALTLVKENTTIPVPDVINFSNNMNDIDSSFLIIKYIDGDNLQLAFREQSHEEKRQIFFNLGNMTYKMHNIQSTMFGTLNGVISENNWYVTFKHLLNNILEDGLKINIELPFKHDYLLALFENARDYFEDVKIPSLIHGDLWPGNVLVQKNNISGIIDFERSLWGDPLMEYPFGLLNSKDFLKGYDKKNIDLFGESSVIRRRFYNIYHYLIVKTENVYRGYKSANTDFITNQKLLSEINSIKSFF